jgi:hypothetical protein
MRIVVTPQLSATGRSFLMMSAGWFRWQCTSTRPGITVLPAAFTIVAPGGIVTRARAPVAVMRSPLTRITESSIAAAPLPSMTRPPTRAVTAPACPRCAWGVMAHAMIRAVLKIRDLVLIYPPVA